MLRVEMIELKKRMRRRGIPGPDEQREEDR